MFGSTPSHRSIGSALAGLMLVALVAALPSMSVGQTSPGSEVTSEQRAGEEIAAAPSSRSTGDASVYWWFYLSALGLAVVGPLGLFVYRRYADEEEYEFDGGEPSMARGSSGEPALADSAQAEGGLSRAEKSFFSSEDAALEESSAQMAFGRSGGAQRICPECGEQFPASVVMCPYDSTPLDKIDDAAGPGEAGDETVLERQRCPGCGRRYEAGAGYCYHDGMRLRQDTVEQAEEAPSFEACRTCGWEGQTDALVCPNDGNELTTVDPSEEERTVPPVPVLVCPECGEYAAPGRGTCPQDGAVLTPIRNAHATELPRHGWGPRRQICQECGDTYSGAAEYCTRDGAELVPMN